MADSNVYGSILLNQNPSNTHADLAISKIDQQSNVMAQINFGPGDEILSGFLTFKTKDSISGQPVERMRIHTNGYVGIGTDNPEFPLHIPDGGLQVGTSPTPANNFYLINEWDIDPNSRTFRLYHRGASTHLLTVASVGGYVGIGTKTPKNKLDVQGSAVIGTAFAGITPAPDQGLLVDGSVGIGKSPGAGNKLDVNGKVNATSFAGEGSAITNLDASKMNIGTLSINRIPNLDASKITTGMFDQARIPNLSASKITTGTFDQARIPNLDASKITTGMFDQARIPNLSASKITGGTINGSLVIDGEINITQSNFVSFHYGNRGKLGDAIYFNPDNDSSGLWLEGTHQPNYDSSGIFMNGNTMCLWSPGDNDLLRIYDEDDFSSSNPNPEPKFVIKGNGRLNKIDVDNNFDAIVRAADFKLGFSDRRGSPGRALVDDWRGCLTINYDKDWPYTRIDSKLVVNGDVDANWVMATGLVVGFKFFKIDHPLDPSNKYLIHASVESAEMMNLYTGNTMLDNNGEAWVELPEWFEALNCDFCYQLTAIGIPNPNLHIAKEIEGNRFKITGGDPSSKVSWQVTGIRHDPFAKKHPFSVEEEKPVEERGYYLLPEVFGQPKEKDIKLVRYSGMMPQKEQKKTSKSKQ